MSDLDAFAARLGATPARLKEALDKGLRRAVLAVDKEHANNLGGSGSAGAYPVPVRTGNLRRARGTRVLNGVSAMVFNRANYASSIHDGFRPFGNPKATPIAGRAFLQDAVDSADPAQYVFAEVAKAVMP